MDIIYLGHSSFKLSGKDASVVTDPFDPKMVGLTYPQISADIVTVSHEHGDHDKIESVTDVHKVIKGPGEYEIRGISIIGYPSFHDNKEGKERGKNTIFIYEIDGIRLAHLGDLGHKLTESLVNQLGDVDVLMVPVGGEYTIDFEVAVEVVRQIEPKIIIPMHYKIKGMNEEMFGKLTGPQEFTSALGYKIEETGKLSLKPGTLADGEQTVVLLSIK